MRISTAFLLPLALIANANAAPFVVSLNGKQNENECEDIGLNNESFVNKVKAMVLNINSNNPGLLPSRTLTETSDRHQDHINDGSGRQLVSNPVAFVMLNTNKDAYFSHGDEGDIVPVEEGNLVIFDGTVPHNTVVNAGVVELMGPFDTVTLRAVGALPPSCASMDPIMFLDGVSACSSSGCEVAIGPAPVDVLRRELKSSKSSKSSSKSSSDGERVRRRRRSNGDDDDDDEDNADCGEMVLRCVEPADCLLDDFECIYSAT